MTQYAIVFDLNTRAMKEAGFEGGDITRVYEKEIPEALATCGFTAHPQGSLYHTEADQDSLTAILQLQGTLRRDAVTFCRFVRRVHVFRMEEWSDVTALIADEAAGGAPDTYEEV